MSSVVPELPPPADLASAPGLLLAELERLVGVRLAATWCADLLEGADPHDYAGILPYLGGRPAQAALDGIWASYWVRTWGARGLRYVWIDDVASAIVHGLDDEHWRPAEMCLKVAALREIGEAGPGSVRWLHHELPRVRAAACRTLGIVGDTEHVALVIDGLADEHADVRRAAARAARLLSRRLDLAVDLDE
jgi:hypothetical protein